MSAMDSSTDVTTDAGIDLWRVQMPTGEVRATVTVLRQGHEADDAGRTHQAARQALQPRDQPGLGSPPPQPVGQDQPEHGESDSIDPPAVPAFDKEAARRRYRA